MTTRPPSGRPDICEQLGRLAFLSGDAADESSLRLSRINRICNLQDSLAIEGNTLSEEKITAILEGKWIIAPPRGMKRRFMANFPL